MENDWSNQIYKSPGKLGGPAFRRSPQRSDEVKQVHVVFNLVGLVAGVVAAVVAYNVTSSIALPIFVYLVTQSYIGRGLGDVATDPHKGKRFVYFTLQPLLAVGVFYATYLLWESMWLSAILGIVIGLMVLWQLLGLIVFPEIHKEEMKDSQDRMKSGGV